MNKRTKDLIALLLAISLLLCSIIDLLWVHRSSDAYIYIGLGACLFITSFLSIKKNNRE